jgi:hypothetical protein
MESSSRDSAMPGSLGELRALGGQVLARRKPWSKLIEPQRFVPPHTVADVNARLRRNLEDFQANYAVFLAGVLAVALLFNPGSAAIVGLLAAGWAFLLTHADVALVVRGRVISRNEKMGLAAAASLAVVLLFSQVAVILASALAFASAAIAAHAALRAPDSDDDGREGADAAERGVGDSASLRDS